MNCLRTLAAALSVAAATLFLTAETANAQWGYGWTSGSPYSAYGGSYYPGGHGYRNFNYSVVNPNGSYYGYSFGYPGYWGSGYPSSYGYSVVPSPQFGVGSYSYVPTYYYPGYYARPGYYTFFSN